MKRSVVVLLLAVLLPCLLLSGLVLQSAQQQQIVLERRTAELCQRETDNVATAARSLVNEQRQNFAEAVGRILAGSGSMAQKAETFPEALRREWPQKAIGFAVSNPGRVLSPKPLVAGTTTEQMEFLKENDLFLCGKWSGTVYPLSAEEMSRPELANKFNVDKEGGISQMKMGTSKAGRVPQRNTIPQGASPKESDSFQQPQVAQAQQPAPAQPAQSPSQEYAANQAVAQQILITNTAQAYRNVAPQQQLDSRESQLSTATGDFCRLTAEGSEGVINRFVGDRLNMIFWVRPAQASHLVFGCMLRPEDLAPHWAEVFQAVRGPRDETDLTLGDGAEPEYLLALLDDQAKPVATMPEARGRSDWKRPFVATEIGEALPHWEAALYLQHPEQLLASARAVQRRLYLLIGCALALVAWGVWAVLADTRRQLALAQKKTDFVSNVSHELKTPLTSIRMFAELMHGGRADPSRVPQYLRIIMVEAERLTRLINNVLDFARREKREQPLERHPLDFHGVIERVWEGHELHLREAGFTTSWEAAPGPYPILGDEDALAQALVNLLSNAEKYSGERKEIRLRSHINHEEVQLVVLDRGCGVPAGEERRIFEAFYRAHDSLSSGIPGTGLGLSLAMRVIEEHGGNIRCEEHPEGGPGAAFTICLPLAPVATREEGR